MAEIRATKDRHEREEDEAERLVRPAPKVKPPRDDLRRERTQEHDPDVDGDPDLKNRDMSLNYKHSGSLAERVAEEWVRVRNKQKDEVTRVKPETLQESPELYEKVPDNEPHNQDGVRPPRTPPRVHKPPYHKDHLPHPKWPDPRPQPDVPPKPPQPPKPPKAAPVPEAPEAEKEPKAKPPGWVKRPRDLTARLVEAYMRLAGDDLVTVRRKEDGKVVRIKPQTFKEAPSDYEEVSEEEAKKAPLSEGEQKAKVKELADSDPAIASALKTLTDPKHPQYELLRSVADKTPAKALLRGQEVPGLDTVADLLRVLNTKGEAPAPKKAPPTKPETPEAPEKDRKEGPADTRSYLPLKKVRELEKDPEFQDFTQRYYGATPSEDGGLTLKTDRDGGAEGTLESLSYDQQTEIVQEFYKWTRAQHKLREKYKDQDPDAGDDPTEPAPAGPEKAPEGDSKKEPPKKEEPAKKPAPEKAPKKETPKEPKPEREKPTKEQIARAQNILSSRFGPKQVQRMISTMHPRDAEAVAAAYDVAKERTITPGKLGAFLADAQTFYTLDPSKVKPPSQGADASGKMKPYAELTPEEQGEAWQQHRNKVLAASLAVREQAYRAYRATGAPKKLARALTLASLGEGGDQAAQKVFEDTLVDGQDEKIPPGRAAKIFEALADKPELQKVAAGYMQARMYQAARAVYLDPRGERGIHEDLPSHEIAARLQEASGYLHEMDQQIPAEVPRINLAATFRDRVYNRLASLDPKKAEKVRPVIDDLERSEYRTQVKAHKEALRAWEKTKSQRDQQRKKIKAQYEKELDKHEKKRDADPYRDMGEPPVTLEERLRAAGLDTPDPPEPAAPFKPARVDWNQKGKDKAEASRALFDDLVKESGATKTARRVMGRWLAFSSFAPVESMSGSRTAVYWGVDPYPSPGDPAARNAPYAYPGWEQAHARDLGDADFKAILTAARQWLKSPVLSDAIEGMVPDARFRAALDLAIRDMENGRYSVGLHPAQYNEILAKLAGVESPATTTLLTIREARNSSYPTTGYTTMKASAEIRKFAARVASNNPILSFDLIDLADKVAEQEQEQAQSQQAKQAQQDQAQQDQAQGKQGGEMPPALKKHLEEKNEGKAEDKAKDQGQGKQAYLDLKAHLVKTAMDNPGQRALFLPLLQTIKRLG